MAVSPVRFSGRVIVLRVCCASVFPAVPNSAAIARLTMAASSSTYRTEPPAAVDETRPITTPAMVQLVLRLHKSASPPYERRSHKVPAGQVRGRRCPHATQRKHCTTDRLNPSGICEISAPVFSRISRSLGPAVQSSSRSAFRWLFTPSGGRRRQAMDHEGYPQLTSK